MNSADQVSDTTGWYSNKNVPSSSQALLEQTFAHAQLYLRSILSPADFRALFPQSPQNVLSHGIDEVQQSLRDAQNAYEQRTSRTSDVFQTIAPTTVIPVPNMPTTVLGKSKAKAKTWLLKLSEKIVHYGNVFDVLVQHHPEYVSLAWGTFKLVFIAITNHAENASKLAQSLAQIADQLPQHSLLLVLYPTPQMQLSVARLYAHIMNFFLSALKWYKEDRIKYAFKAVLQPWDLKFKEGFDAIASEAQQIRQLADVAMKSELRSTRQGVEQGTRHLELVLSEMQELRGENERLHKLVEGKLESIRDSMMYMYQELRVDFASQRGTLNRVHLNQMLSLPLWNNLPTSGESLRYCRSMRDRRRDWNKLPLPEVAKLETWSAQSDKTVLLIDTHALITAKTFMIDLIDLIVDNGTAAIWALRFAEYWDQRMTTVDVMRMLVLQAMQTGSDRLLNSPFPVMVEHIRDAASLKDWVAILKRLLSYVNHAFLVLDPDLLGYVTAHERGVSMELLDLLRTELSASVKIVIGTSSVSRGYVEELQSTHACVKIQVTSSNWRKPRRQARARVRLQNMRRPGSGRVNTLP